jgi:hypothetical protein
MVIGVDFDNTIVRYDDLFHRLAVEKGLIPADLPSRKMEVRDYLRSQGQEREWTELQGYVYGPRMSEAQPFPGVLDFFRDCIRRGVPVSIISHKTPKAVAGPAYDLQQAARDWLELQGFFDPKRIGLARERVHFGATREEKIQLIRANKCTLFIDDLEETFLEKSFPADVQKILFNQPETPKGLEDVVLAADWAQVSKYVFQRAN